MASIKLNSNRHENKSMKIKRHNTYKSAINADKSKLKPDSSLGSFGRKMFKSIAKNNKQLNSSDSADVNILCHTFEIYINANEHLEKDGLIVHGKKSPYYSIVKQSVDTIIKLSSQLNILPKNRINADFHAQDDTKKDPVRVAFR